jgi:catechol 2,3-dioxygenase-like lactoylglutathione lyase family enzyme
MQIVALDHIQIAMPKGKEAEARWFYGELLGLHEVPKPTQLANRGGCWFSGDVISVHLGVMHSFIPATKAHPAFRVFDLEAARQRFVKAGIAITFDNTLPHVRRFYVNDPFGNRIEFLQNGDRY